MQIGLITDSLSHLPFEEALDIAAEAGLSSVEIATGNWSTAPHANLSELVESEAARAKLTDAVRARHLTISALNANGNQLHPVTGPAHDDVVRRTIEAAGLLGVPTVVLMSGLPGGPGDSSANWITTSWPPENLAILEYQWNEIALPYWDSLTRFAKDHGVRLAVEMCGSQLVYNVSTMKRLADATDPTVVGANLDPSHLMWMGADIPSVIRSLGSRIFHVHAKDVRINRHNAAHNGVLDTVDVTDPHARAWNYVTLGLGHPEGATFWADFVYTLRSVGYDGTLNIEHEDALVNAAEGVQKATRLLQQVILEHAPDWQPAQI
ncbi:sugar phosphate isomerase/epimerase family protein [Rhodococcoides fascians]|uniref:sugar phosphate isomerase/epimerase family protein n=1 Tax=Rhodococcoides fascians TaxID=1828 RepID=UPI00056B3081|nr:sugar phosphate isomerase/epimerase [Rhodococcus fascians]